MQSHFCTCFFLLFSSILSIYPIRINTHNSDYFFFKSMNLAIVNNYYTHFMYSIFLFVRSFFLLLFPVSFFVLYSMFMIKNKIDEICIKIFVFMFRNWMNCCFFIEMVIGEDMEATKCSPIDCALTLRLLFIFLIHIYHFPNSYEVNAINALSIACCANPKENPNEMGCQQQKLPIFFIDLLNF